MGLENEGYTVLAASDPREGIRMFKEQSRNISLVLLDLCMSELSGDRMFECLWKIAPEVPVLLISSFCKENGPAGELRENVRGCLLMPFPLNDLIEKVRELVSFA